MKPVPNSKRSILKRINNELRKVIIKLGIAHFQIIVRRLRGETHFYQRFDDYYENETFEKWWIGVGPRGYVITEGCVVWSVTHKDLVKDMTDCLKRSIFTNEERTSPYHYSDTTQG